MKNITELSEKEILALTNDELETMVKLEMANEGIKILPLPTEPIYEALPPKTETLYAVNGFAYHFTDKEIANKISQEIIKVAQDTITTDYKYPSYGVKWVKQLDSYIKDALGDVKQELFYSRTDSIAIADIAKKNEDLKKQYTDELSEYDTSKNASTEIRDRIFGAYYAVQQKYYDFNILTERYNEYLSIANGDKDMAMKFLKKAYIVSDEAEDYIIANQKQEAVKPPAKVSDEVSGDDLPDF